MITLQTPSWPSPSPPSISSQVVWGWPSCWRLLWISSWWSLRKVPCCYFSFYCKSWTKSCHILIQFPRQGSHLGRLSKVSCSEYFVQLGVVKFCAINCWCIWEICLQRYMRAAALNSYQGVKVCFYSFKTIILKLNWYQGVKVRFLRIL